jgi:hypothetical protein
VKTLKVTRLFAAAALLGSGTIAHADAASGAVAWAAGQSSVVCYLFNTSANTVYITSKAIIAEGSGSTYPLSGSCGTSLAPFQICVFVTSVPAGGANACYASLSPTGANVRGEMEVRGSAGVLNSIELR